MWGIYRLFVFVGVTLAWVFFRVPDSELACRMIAKMFTGPWQPFGLWTYMSATNLALVLLCLLFVVVELMLYRGWYPRRWWWRAGGFAALIVLISLFAVSSEKFVYFQF